MPQTILIVEDEQSAARVLSGICAELGLSVRVTGSGREAVEECAKAAGSPMPFAGVILDLVLSESDGFQFAQAARTQPWGMELPLVVVSGIYKVLPPDFAAKIKPAAFFAKPFEPKALREALTRITGATGGAQPVEGNLSQTPVAALLVDLLRQKQTGTLTIQGGETKRVLTYQQGMIRFAQSNIKGEAVGAPLVASGAVKQASFDRAVALARQQGISLHEALGAARVLTPEQLKTALKQSAADVTVGALGLRTGIYKFEPKAAEAVTGTPDVRSSPVALVLEGAKRIGKPDEARRWLETHGQEKVNRSPELEREMFTLKASWPGESVTPAATAGKTIAEVLGRVKEAELPLLKALCESGLLHLTGGAAKNEAKAQEVAAQAAADADRGKTFKPAEMTARKLLFEERERLKDASHYQVLGVEPGAGPDEIKQAYFAAAKRFHSDSFSGLELGSARRTAEELFGKVGEAYSVLTDKNKRAEHDVYLERKAKGLPTDVVAILRAEGIFQKGEVQFKQGKWEDAETSFKEAIALNHAEAEFHAYLGMTIFKRTGKPELGLPHLETALELDPRLPSGVLFGAQLAEAAGDPDRAQQILREAIKRDPGFADAKDAMRRLRNRPAEPENKGGFFSRLLSKK